MPDFKGCAAIAVVVAMAAFILTIPSQAATVDFADPAFAQVTGQTSTPIGHAEFCKSHRSACGPNANPVQATALTEKLWAQLVTVNNQMNASIVPVTDQAFYNLAEYWTYADGYGDCEDIALDKQRALIAAGWNPSTLLMTVVRQDNGEGHAVLMVRTDRGDLVLDNQQSDILVWNQTPYQFIKRQSQANAGQWVGIADGRGLFVASK
jgi:predicted transglutaminase-like cysteine proteinase